ncbi:MAG: ABC transporter permease subunit, partial [Anaerolineae bacterium]|nr:ABC transporter permease subunit [Anaerolineae bacterium]
MSRYLLRRLISGLLVLLAITYVSYLAQEWAFRSRANLPAPLTEVAGQALRESLDTWRRLPQGDLGRYTSPSTAYAWQRTQPLGRLLGGMLARSIALLLLAMLLGGLLGGVLGLLAAAARRRRVSLAFISLSIVGVSAPSFLLGMLLQYAEISLHKSTGIQLLPVGGFGWDTHLVLPVLVLAARPIAQVARLTFVRVSAVLEEDHVRTARAKGLLRRTVWSMHIIRNASGTILTAMGTSLRFALSSLPVVEVLFGWPGAAKAMLDMLRSSQRHGATVLLLIMGALFVAVNVGLDLLYRLLDPRLRETETRVHMETRPWEGLKGIVRELKAIITLQRWRERPQYDAQDSPLRSLREQGRVNGAWIDADEERAAQQRKAHWRHWRNAALTNPALILGAIMGATLLVLVVAGPSFARHNPYSSAVSLSVEGQELWPPLPPSATFPFGTDSQGRDILSLLLAGARRTLTIAFFAVLARLMVGGILGFIAGWFADSRLDGAIMGLAETLAAFPALLLAMLVVFAVGVRQGMTAFVIALACIGWGEVMQTVRSQVMRIKPMAYIESAVATGLSQGQVLSAHVLPNVWPTMVSLAFLEMGAVLMI